MNINRNNLVWGNIFDYLSGFRAYKKGEPIIRMPSGKDSDTVQISPQSKRQMKDAEIEKTINSGEPMTGVSYEEYCNYFIDKNGYIDQYKMKHEYKQALKGDNASLREKEWRTNPEYCIPPRLYSSPEVTADREAALEKFRNGEKLEEWESGILMTFPDAGEGCKLYNEANTERTRKNMQSKIDTAVSKLGIELSDDDELTLEVWGYEMKISGNIDSDALKELNDALSKHANGFQNLYHMYHEDEAKQGGFSLVYMWGAERYLKEAGGEVSVTELSFDKDGNITGLPDELDSFIKENAIGEFGFDVSPKYADRADDIKKALYMKEAFTSAVKSVQSGNYERLKSMTCKLTYKNGVLSC